MVQNIKIQEFEPRFGTEAVELICAWLVKLGLAPESVRPSADSDLSNINDVYSGRSRFWVALDNSGKVVGTAAIREMDTDSAELKRMYVEEAWHSKGVAQQLLLESLVFAKRQSYKKIILETNKVMTRAHRFYEKHGFVRTSENEQCYFYERLI